MMEQLKALIMEEEGQGMAEYALILGVLAVGVVVVLGFFGEEIVGIFQTMVDEFQDINTGS